MSETQSCDMLRMTQMMSELIPSSLRLNKLWIPLLNHLSDGDSFISIFLKVFDYYFVYTSLAHIAATNAVAGSGTN